MARKKRKIKFRKVLIAEKVLKYLGETSLNLLDLSFKIIFEPEDIVGGLIQFRGKSRYKHIHNLKNSPYFKHENNKFYVTEKGRIKIIRGIIKDKKIENKEWDGRWRGISFDIPELKRKERDFLRRELKQMSLKEIQKSVWITPYNIEKELSVLLKLWKLDFEGDIRFLVIERIIEDKDIKKFFNLV